MIVDLKPNGSYADTLNPLQQQMLAELGIDYLWGKSLSPDLQKVLSKSVADAGVDAHSTAAVSQQQDSSQQDAAISGVTPAESFTPASQESAQAHAEEARKMLQRARHRLPDTPNRAASEVAPLSQANVSLPPMQSTQVRTVPAAPEAQKPEVSQSPSVQPKGSLSEMSWQELRVYAEGCHACELNEQRQKTVFSNQSEERQADWLFIEQMPSESDDKQGQPMSAEAGALFEQMLLALGLQRSDIAILPLIKCRPTHEGSFKKEWLSACSPILIEQIKRIKPKCIVAFGDAATSLLQEDSGLLALRRRELFFEHPQTGRIPVIATFSPHYLLLNSSEKAQTWQDLKRARQIIRGHA